VAGVAEVKLIVHVVVEQAGPVYDFALALWQDDFALHGACHQHYAERVRQLDDSAMAPFGDLRWSRFYDLDGDGCGDLPGGGHAYRFGLADAQLFCDAEGNLLPVHVCPHWNTEPDLFCKHHKKVRRKIGEKGSMFSAHWRR
jgi:hypothetical protein